MVLVRVRSYSQLFGTRIRAAASSIVSHPMAWFVGVGTRLAAGAGVGAGCLPCVLESKRSGTRADWAPRSETGELGIFFIPSISATARALMEVVIFRTRCGRSAREGGIPQGIHERSIRGSTGGRGIPRVPVRIVTSILLSLSPGLSLGREGLPLKGVGVYGPLVNAE